MNLFEPLGDITQADNWSEIALSVGLRLAGAMVALYLGARMAKWTARLASRALATAQVEATAAQFLARLAYVLLLVVLALAILQLFFGVQPASMFAVLGAAGLAVGLALKDSLSNVASGVMLVTLKPFRVGDVVEIAAQTGKVETITIFQTRLRGADNQTVSLPNSLITAAPIINRSPGTMRRVELVIGIDYGDNIDAARQAALDVMHADPRVLAEPSPDVLVYDLAASSVNLGIRCHVDNDDWFAVKCALLERIKKAFDANGIHIPYPQQDMHLFVRNAEGARTSIGEAFTR
ncbi:mechanosensitive ion channel family protein [Lysobacter niabensis]|uniref:mechanosensitive ion channel family protein n=1 Tax=Agrilutibacter niabensis TaxID=380628 RepID=UPI0036207862